MYKLKCENYNNLYIYIYKNPKNMHVHIYSLKNVALESLRLIDVNFK